MVSLIALIKRNIKLFCRDKLTMFFSLLAPLITLMLFILFLRSVQIDSVTQFLTSFGVTDVNQLYINGVVHGWFLSSVLAVSLISVGLSFYYIMVRDKEYNTINDFLTTPTSKRIIKLSYFVSAVIVNIIIGLIILALGILYLVITKTMFMSFVDVLLTICNIILSSISACLIMMLIASLFDKESQLGGFTGILSSLVGFVIGAYMPVSTFPTAIQYIIGLVPGTYSAGIFRNIMMRGALGKMSNIDTTALNAIKEYFGTSVNFFGTSISYGMCYLFLSVSILITLVIALIVFGKKKKAKISVQNSNK